MHSYSNATESDEMEDPAVQHIPRSIAHLQQCVEHAQSRMAHLSGLTMPEFGAELALARTTELDAERNRIRSANERLARQLAETYLLQLKDVERQNEQLRQRLKVLETRTTLGETIREEQMALNRELADEAVRTLRQFADAERRRAAVVKAANQRCESMTRELERAKAHREQLEQTIARMRDRENTLNKQISAMAHQLSKAESDKNGLRLDRDKCKGEADSANSILKEQENTIAGLRERETTAVLELRQRDSMIDSLAKERDDARQEVLRTRREFESLLARQERETDKRLKEKRREVEAELRAKYAEELNRYRTTLHQHRKDFERALHEALQETQKLAADREQYFNNWRRIEDTLEQYKQKLKATLSRKMVAKCSELVRDLKDIGADENGPRVPAAPRTLEPVENVAQRFLDDMANQRDSGAFS